MPRAAGLRPWPQPAAIGRAAAWRDAQGSVERRLQVRSPRRGHRHEPTVPDEARDARYREGICTMSVMTSPRQRNSRELSRRRFLRGTGVVMALPWLESLPVWGAELESTAAPKRLAIPFMGNGVNPTEGWARGSGSTIELGRSLAPMEPLRGKFNYIKGLFNKAATGVGIHPGMTGNLLSGARLTKGAELHGGVSLDQVLASHIGDQTVQPSMVLGCEQPVTGYHETNFSMAYSSHISWSSP